MNELYQYIALKNLKKKKNHNLFLCVFVCVRGQDNLHDQLPRGYHGLMPLPTKSSLHTSFYFLFFLHCQRHFGKTNKQTCLVNLWKGI